MTPMRLPRVTVTIEDDYSPAWTLELSTTNLVTTHAPLLRANTERVLSLLRTYRELLDHLVEISADTDARGYRRSEREGSE